MIKVCYERFIKVLALLGPENKLSFEEFTLYYHEVLEERYMDPTNIIFLKIHHLDIIRHWVEEDPPPLQIIGHEIPETQPGEINPS